MTRNRESHNLPLPIHITGDTYAYTSASETLEMIVPKDEAHKVSLEVGNPEFVESLSGKTRVRLGRNDKRVEVLSEHVDGRIGQHVDIERGGCVKGFVRGVINFMTGREMLPPETFTSVQGADGPLQDPNMIIVRDDSGNRKYMTRR